MIGFLMDVGHERKRGQSENLKIVGWRNWKAGVAIFQGVRWLWEEMTWGGQESRVWFQTLSLKCKSVTHIEIWSRQ